jgi:site-specific recombinase XerD
MATKLKVVKPKPANALQTLVSDYLAHQRGRGLSPRTVALTANTLERILLPWCATNHITTPVELTQRTIDRFAADVLDRDLAHDSKRTYLRTTSTFIRWAQADDAIVEKVKLHQPKAQKRVLETLDRQQIQKLEDAANTERDKLIVRVLGDCGLRLGELLGLRPGDLVEQGRERYLHVRGKGARERLVPVAPALFQRLRRYANRGGERIFVTNRRQASGQYEPLRPRSVQNMLKFLATTAEITVDLHPHTLRHSAVTNMLRRGMNPVVVQRIMGWESLDMLKVYEHLVASDTYSAMLDYLRVDS